MRNKIYLLPFTGAVNDVRKLKIPSIQFRPNFFKEPDPLILTLISLIKWGFNKMGWMEYSQKYLKWEISPCFCKMDGGHESNSIDRNQAEIDSCVYLLLWR